ncbi:DUF6227 family protein [Streptomyces sp. NPDC012888]|uniref:DUF6227 family protein n=1 Tax=Streptomyces sp. NPDC012888 TaxID=3364855 RepID=UPI0036CEA5D7
MSDPYETTEAHLERLLGRALNSFDLPDPLVERLETALAHSSSLHTAHHEASGRWQETHRHTYLLADGGATALWELVYRQEDDPEVRSEVFAGREELALAVDRLSGGERARGGGFVLLPEGPDGADAAGDDVAALSALFAATAAAPAQRHRQYEYAVDQSADHARRVLRRAENADRPGEDTARLLTAAYGHRITQVFGGRQCVVDGRDAGFSLYEHAFLLLDGSEFSLWEVEHTATPDGRHMCEVYCSEAAARGAMELRARVR